jgi:hypothetical protein
MKNMQENNRKNGSGMGTTTADREFMKQRTDRKQQSVSNAGSQRSDQTSSRDGRHKPEHKS